MMLAPGADLLEGSPYRILGSLGAGGMGDVFEAEHRGLGHRVVVKVLREPYTGRSEMHDRMRVEGQALARIRDPHLVMVTDIGTTRSGRPFIVMERLIGRSLRDEMLVRGFLPVVEAAEIGRQMLRGLSVAHEAGLVHRDIKPDNVFLCSTEDGRPFVKVLDFGVVKVAQAGRDPRTPEPLLIPTAEGVAVGTPRYFSPEQTRGSRDLDERSDLYSVGLVLYTMVVGAGPFDRCGSIAELFHAHATEAPLPPSKAATQPIPIGLEQIILRALQKPREERFQTALSFIDALDVFLDECGVEGERVRSSVPRVLSSQRTKALHELTTFPALVVENLGAKSPGSIERNAATRPVGPRWNESTEELYRPEAATRTASPVGSTEASSPLSDVSKNENVLSEGATEATLPDEEGPPGGNESARTFPIVEVQSFGGTFDPTARQGFVVPPRDSKPAQAALAATQDIVVSGPSPAASAPLVSSVSPMQSRPQGVLLGAAMRAPRATSKWPLAVLVTVALLFGVVFLMSQLGE